MRIPQTLLQEPASRIAHRTAALWDRHQEVAVAYLFGSLARGRPTPLSDVDIAVLVGEDRDCDPLALAGELMDALDTDAVDLLLLDRANPTIRHRVLRDGLILFCRDERARVDFTRRALLEYFDAEPLRKAGWVSIRRWCAARTGRG